MVKGRLKSCIFDGGKIRQELADDTLNTEQIQVQNVMIQTQSVVPLTFQPREGGSRSDLGMCCKGLHRTCSLSPRALQAQGYPSAARGRSFRENIFALHGAQRGFEVAQ